MKKQITELRIRIDGLAQLVKELAIPIIPTANVHECHKSLLLSKAWLGKVLGELGAESPYKNDGNRKTVEDIEPCADTWTPKQKEEFMPIVMKIDRLREEIKAIDVAIINVVHKYCAAKSHELIYLLLERTSNASRHLSEARFHLGFELQRLKENSIAKEK